MINSSEFSEQTFQQQAKKDGITHISTGVAVINDKKILMVRRQPNDYLGGVYELPGGGVDTGETIVEGASRELLEETGLVISKVISTFDGFDYTTDQKPHVRQVNLLAETKSTKVKLNFEHDDFIWVDENNLNNLNMTDNMRKCLINALQIIK
jgi:8-oxo-dGTP diphosphatase